MRYLDRAPIIFVCISAYFFAASTAYVNGYFRVLGLDSDLMARNLHEVLYHGMELSLIPFFKLLLCSFFLIFVNSLYRVALSGYIYQNYTEAKKMIKRLNKLKTKLKLQSKKARYLEKMHSKRVLKAGLSMIMFFIFVLVLGSYERKGESAANFVKERIKSGEINRVNLESQKLGKNLGYLYCGSRNCAAIDIKKNSIVYFPQNGHIYSRDSLKAE
jgi:hypothetical protein